MSFPKMGKSLPEKGNVLPESSSYAVAVSIALQQHLGGTRRAIKTLTGWTGASDRAVKGWLSGASGPSGEHLVTLIRHSDEVLEAMLLLGGRPQLLAAIKIHDATSKLIAALKILEYEGG